MRTLPAPWRAGLLLVLLVLAFDLPGLLNLPVTDRDEARFAQASKQMVESGDYLHIRVQNRPRHKKPAGIYWLQAAAVRLTGGPRRGVIWPYRLPSLAGALLAVLLTAAAGRRAVGGNAAAWGAALLAGAPLLVGEAQLATTDAALLAATVAAQGALLRAYLAGRGAGEAPTRTTAAVFGVALGAGILLKGPVTPLVVGLTVLALWAVDREIRWLAALRPLLGLAIAAAMVLPWGLAVEAASGGRFLTDAWRGDLLPKLLSGHESHGALPGAYLLALPLTFFPAALFLPPALAAAWRRRGDPAVRFLLAWLAPSWLVFELLPTKLPHYVLPLLPALALLTGRHLAPGTAGAVGGWPTSAPPITVVRRWLAGAWRGVWWLAALLLAAALAAIPSWLDSRLDGVALTAGGLALAAATVAAWAASRGRRRPAAAAALVATFVVLVPALAWTLPHTRALWPSRELAAVLERTALDARRPLVVAGFHEPSVVFTLGTQTRLVSTAGAAKHLAAHPDSLAVVPAAELPEVAAELERRGLAVRQLARVRGLDAAKGRWLELAVVATVAGGDQLRADP